MEREETRNEGGKKAAVQFHMLLLLVLSNLV